MKFHLCPTVLALVTLSPAFAYAASQTSTPSPSYLGTYPQAAGKPPIAADDISTFGVDADGNRYFADTADGTVLRIATDGSRSIVLSGLKPGIPQATLVVDYRGNLFAADPGNHRIVSVAAGTSAPIVRATPVAPHSLAVDTTGDCFYLSGSALYQIPPAGEPRRIGNFPGATLIAYGPASGEDDTIYVLSAGTKPNAYSVSTFTYHNGAGVIAADRTFTSTATISAFVVDTARNLILATETAGAASLQQVSPAGQTNLVTATTSGTAPAIALDFNRNLFYLDRSGIFSMMTGAVNFGSVLSPFGGGSFFGMQQVVVAIPPGTGIVTIDLGDFVDNFDPSSDCGWPGNLCHIPLYFVPGTLGLEAGMFVVQDQSGNTIARVPLYGNGLYPLHNIFTPNSAKSSTPLYTSQPYQYQAVKSASGLSATNANLPTLITDVATGSLVTPFLQQASIAGMGKPETVAQYPYNSTYVTQANMPGVLRIDSNLQRSRVAERLSTEPNDVAVDDTGNLYISDRNSVFRVGLDGTETELANPDTDGGYARADSLAVDGTGNVSVFFHSGGPSGHGGLVKISPAGAFTSLPIPEGVTSGTAMGLDSGGALYISDGVSHTLSTVRTDGTTLNLLSGLKVPKGVSGYYWPAVIDQGTDALVQPTLPDDAFNFGSVPVGTSVTHVFTLIANGNDTSYVYVQSGNDSEFSFSALQFTIAPGASAQLSITYKPTVAGPHATQFITTSNDFNLPDGGPSFFLLSGTGVAAKK